MIEKEIIKKARQTDLAAYLISKGEPLKKMGRRHKHKVHDSLIITGNMFFWNSRQKKGNSLDFAMLYYGLSFDEAVKELTGVNTPKVEYRHEIKPLSITKGNNVKRVFAYLCKTRKINYNLVKRLIESHHISQDEKGNCIFKVYNEAGELVDGEIVGTLSDTRFKSTANGTSGYGFNVIIGEPIYNLFFESSIDLLSFWTLNVEKITRHRLVSLSGLRIDIFENIVKTFKIDPNTVFLCVDNDIAGKTFIEETRKIYEGVREHLPPDIYKDWSEFLQSGLE